jgi:hypothetical protein
MPSQLTIGLVRSVTVPMGNELRTVSVEGGHLLGIDRNVFRHAVTGP